MLVSPAGYVSVNGADSVIAPLLVLPMVTVSVDVPPGMIVVGANDLASVGRSSTVSVALAGGATPAEVDSVPVVFSAAPAVLLVTFTLTTQPPAGIDVPLAMVKLPAPLPAVTPEQVVPVVSAGLVLVRPAGYVSANTPDSVMAKALLLPMVTVIVEVPPCAMVVGLKLLASVGRLVTISVDVAGAPTPAVVDSDPVVLTAEPDVLLVTFTFTTQLPAPNTVPLAMVNLLSAAVAVTPEQVVPVVSTGLVLVMPAGYVSVNSPVSVIALVLALLIVTVSVDVPPGAMVEGVKDLASVGTFRIVNVAVAAGATPAEVDSAPVVLTAAPEVLLVTASLTTQPPTGIDVPLAMLKLPAPLPAVTPAQVVPVVTAGLVLVSPAGYVSVNTPDSVIALALVLPMVTVSVDVPPGAMAVGSKDFASEGAASTVSDAAAVLPVPPLVDVTLPLMLFLTPVDAPVTVTFTTQAVGLVTVAPENVSVAAPGAAAGLNAPAPQPL